MITLLVTLAVAAGAQSIERDVVGTTGTNTVSGGSMQVSQTVGEAVIGGGSASGITATQGFQQSGTTIISVEEVTVELEHSLWPNPMKDQLNVRLSADEAIEGRMVLVNMSGQVVAERYADIPAGTTYNHSFNTARLTAGVYMVNFITDEESHSVAKVVKQE